MSIFGIKAHEEISDQRIRHHVNGIWFDFSKRKTLTCCCVIFALFFFLIVSTTIVLTPQDLFSNNLQIVRVYFSIFYSNGIALSVIGLLIWLIGFKTEIEPPISELEQATHILGFDVERQVPIAVINEIMRTHIFLIGSTGSGKTMAILALLYQSMLQGGGVIYIDGKAENKTFEKLYTLCRKAGRLNDLLVINYLTAETVTNKPKSLIERELLKRSNTVNILLGANEDEIKELIIDLLRDTGGSGGDVFKGRANDFLSVLLKVMVWKRDNDPTFNMTLNEVTKHFELNGVQKLIKEGRSGIIPEKIFRPLELYYQSIPGYDAENNESIHETMSEQHGYIAMQLTEVFNTLLSTYGEIYDVDSGSVNYRDVVMKRRIIYVMLPTTSKSKEAMKMLAKLNLSCLKRAVTPTIGSRLQGHSSEIFQNPLNKDGIPFILAFDETRYVMSPNIASLFAQLRSLGFSIITGTQSYSGLEDDNMQIEAAEILSNTNIKIFMKIEPDNKTENIITNRGGTANVLNCMGFNNIEQLVSSKKQPNSKLTIQQLNRINMRDIMKQEPGEAHIVYKDKIMRAKMLYLNTEHKQFKKTKSDWYFLNITLPVFINRDHEIYIQNKISNYKIKKGLSKNEDQVLINSIDNENMSSLKAILKEFNDNRQREDQGNSLYEKIHFYKNADTKEKSRSDHKHFLALALPSIKTQLPNDYKRDLYSIIPLEANANKNEIAKLILPILKDNNSLDNNKITDEFLINISIFDNENEQIQRILDDFGFIFNKVTLSFSAESENYIYDDKT